jgi:hypothetical protein
MLAGAFEAAYRQASSNPHHLSARAEGNHLPKRDRTHHLAEAGQKRPASTAVA